MVSLFEFLRQQIPHLNVLLRPTYQGTNKFAGSEKEKVVQQVQTTMKNYFPLRPFSWVDLMTLKVSLANKDAIWRL